MEMKTEYKFEISESTYNLLKDVKHVTECPKDFCSTNRTTHIVFTEPSTQESFKVKTSKVIEAVGEHRKVYLSLEMVKVNFKRYYMLKLTLKL